MKEDNTKSLVMNIITVTVVVALLVVGYFVFLKKGTPAISDTSIALVAQETSSLGIDIDSTIRSLKNLSRAVESATIIFDLPAFKNLQDFSVKVPSEGVGRPNPFVPADWKLKLIEAEGAKGAGGKSETTTIVPIPVTAPVVTTPTPVTVPVSVPVSNPAQSTSTVIAPPSYPMI